MADPKETPTNFFEKGLYSVTINPDDKHQYFGNNDRLQKFRNFINEELISLPTIGIKYYFRIELSEPQDNNTSQSGPRLHLHGIIQLCSKKAVKHLMLDVLYKWTRFSKYKLDTITSPEKWILYIMKQQHIMNTPAVTCLDEETYANEFWPHRELLGVTAGCSDTS